MLLSLLSLLALSAPVMSTDGDVVTGSVELGVPPDAIRARLSDPTWLPTISRDGTDVRVLRDDGPCQILESVSPSALMTVRYETRRCPTEAGFRSTLVESNAFSTYETSWTLEPSEAGTRATYRIRAVSTLWVPRAVIRRSVRNGIESMLSNLEEWGRQSGT